MAALTTGGLHMRT